MRFLEVNDETKEKAKQKPYLTRHPILLLPLLLFLATIIWLVSLDWIIRLILASRGIAPTEEVDPEIINGVLTSIAVLFGFQTLRVNIPQLVRKGLLAVLVLLITEIYMIVVVTANNVLDVLNYRHATIYTLMLSLVFWLSSLQ
jgi:hypothetical protein